MGGYITATRTSIKKLHEGCELHNGCHQLIFEQKDLHIYRINTILSYRSDNSGNSRVEHWKKYF